MSDRHIVLKDGGKFEFTELDPSVATIEHVGVQISADRKRFWLCINGVSVLRFKTSNVFHFEVADDRLIESPEPPGQPEPSESEPDDVFFAKYVDVLIEFIDSIEAAQAAVWLTVERWPDREQYMRDWYNQNFNAGPGGKDLPLDLKLLMPGGEKDVDDKQGD